MSLFSITFKKPLRIAMSGLSPGGAIFPFSIIIGAEGNTLYVKHPQQVEQFSSNPLSFLFDFGKIKVIVAKSILKDFGYRELIHPLKEAAVSLNRS